MIYPILNGAYCVPSALMALTGEDLESVIFPALNRHAKAQGLLTTVGGAYLEDAERVLNELGYAVRHAKTLGKHRVATWAKQTLERNYSYPMMLGVRRHVVVAYQGRVYDNHAAHGPAGDKHPYAGAIVTYAVLVVPRR